MAPLKNILLLLVALNSSPLIGQNINSHWLFGFNGHLVFDESGVTSPSEGPISSIEGSCSVSNEAGDLLFSTDGQNIFDASGDVMPEGSGLFGHPSSTQNSLIVPQPGDNEERFYYVFTVPSTVSVGEGGTTAMHYSIVDMTLNNGLGNTLGPPQALVSDASEKLHATYHSNGKDIWVMTHKLNTNSFYAYLVTCDGIEDPVISNSGEIVDAEESVIPALGALKFSVSGDLVAMTYTERIVTGSDERAWLQIGEFDNSTGEVNVIESDYIAENGSIMGYGLEFSPNGENLYWSCLGNMNRLMHLELNTANPIQNATQLFAGGIFPIGALQLAPNGRIYVALADQSNSLMSIENPNEPNPEEVILNENSITFQGISGLGLPNHWRHVTPEVTYTVLDTIEVFSCEADSQVLSVPSDDDTQILWSTGEITAEITVNSPGLYWAKVDSPCEATKHFFEVISDEEPPFTIVGETSLCTGNSTVISIETEADVVWADGNSNATRTFSSPGTYPFNIQTDHCNYPQSIDIEQLSFPQVSFSEHELELCLNSKLEISPEYSFADSLVWDDVITANSFVAEAPGIYTVKGYNACGVDSAQIDLILTDCSCPLYFPNTFTPNEDGINDLFGVSCSCEFDQFAMQIFARNGNMVFFTNDPNFYWDGSFADKQYYCQDGVYVVQVTGRFRGTEGVSDFVKQGHITLLR